MASTAADITDIANLLKRERFYRDTAQWDLCRSAFHPHAPTTYINVAWYEGDVEEFLRQSMEMHKGKINIIHSSFDPVHIRVCGNRAISEAFCLVTSSVTLDGIDYELASHMRLATRLEKSPDLGQWHMLSLEALYVRDRLVTSFPRPIDALPLLMTDEIQAYPKSYRHLALVMLSRGLRPRPGLPHEDNQESIRRVLDRNRAYLDGVEEEPAKH
ncbi:MAG: hypothetical protein Q9165_008358 [Trypethelium subeluteriae]